MERRGFLKLLGLGAAEAAALALDPERLLWVLHGAKTIFLPSPGQTLVFGGFEKGDIFTIAGRYAVHPVTGKTLDFLRLPMWRLAIFTQESLTGIFRRCRLRNGSEIDMKLTGKFVG